MNNCTLFAGEVGEKDEKHSNLDYTLITRLAFVRTCVNAYLLILIPCRRYLLDMERGAY